MKKRRDRNYSDPYNLKVNEDRIQCVFDLGRCMSTMTGRFRIFEPSSDRLGRARR